MSLVHQYCVTASNNKPFWFSFFNIINLETFILLSYFLIFNIVKNYFFFCLVLDYYSTLKYFQCLICNVVAIGFRASDIPTYFILSS